MTSFAQVQAVKPQFVRSPLVVLLTEAWAARKRVKPLGTGSLHDAEQGRGKSFTTFFSNTSVEAPGTKRSQTIEEELSAVGYGKPLRAPEISITSIDSSSKEVAGIAI